MCVANISNTCGHRFGSDIAHIDGGYMGNRPMIDGWKLWKRCILFVLKLTIFGSSWVTNFNPCPQKALVRSQPVAHGLHEVLPDHGETNSSPSFFSHHKTHTCPIMPKEERDKKTTKKHHHPTQSVLQHFPQHENRERMNRHGLIQSQGCRE